MAASRCYRQQMAACARGESPWLARGQTAVSIVEGARSFGSGGVDHQCKRATSLGPALPLATMVTASRIYAGGVDSGDRRHHHDAGIGSVHAMTRCWSWPGLPYYAHHHPVALYHRWHKGMIPNTTDGRSRARHRRATSYGLTVSRLAALRVWVGTGGLCY